MQYWTEKDVDFSHCSKPVQRALIATLKPILTCIYMLGPDMKEYLVELRRVIDKAIEIGDKTDEHD